MAIDLEAHQRMEETFGVAFDHGDDLAKMVEYRRREQIGGVFDAMALDAKLAQPDLDGADLELFCPICITDALAGIGWWMRFVSAVVNQRIREEPASAHTLGDDLEAMHARAEALFPRYIEAYREWIDYELSTVAIRESDADFEKGIELLRAYRQFTRHCSDVVHTAYPQIYRPMLDLIP